MLTALVSTAAGAPRFAAPFLSFPCCSGPIAIAVDDLDGDGVPDVVASGWNGFSIQRGVGDGTLATAEQYLLGGLAPDIAIGRLNNDPYPDIAVANPYSACVTILFGRGGGTFVAPGNVPAGCVPQAFDLVDLNRDGDQDFVFVDDSTSTVAVLYGDGTGTGTFVRRASFATGAPAVAVVAADLNGDGFPDIVTTGRTAKRISVLLGDAEGALGPPVDIPLPRLARDMAVGDLDRDGVPDLVTVGDSACQVLRGLGDGTFASTAQLPIGITYAVAITDADGDDWPDIVVPNRDGPVSVWRGDGHGGFERGGDFAAGGLLFDVAPADLDGDGRIDLVVCNSRQSGRLAVLPGTGQGGFGGGWECAVEAGPSRLAVGDFDRDGRPDVAVSSSGSHRVSILRGGPEGRLGDRTTLLAAGHPSRLATGDLDGNGRLDVVAASTDSISVFLGKGDGTFGEASFIPTLPATNALNIVDMNGDDVPDLVLTSAGTWQNYNQGSVAVLLGRGDGGFEAEQDYAGGLFCGSGVVADLDGDGHPDVVAGHSSHPYVTVFMNRGDGTLAPGRDEDVVGATSYLELADMNGDGRPDLVGDGARIALGNGDGTFAPAQSASNGALPCGIGIGDLNGDGVPDLAVANSGDETVTVLTGSGDGTLIRECDFGVGKGPWDAALLDFDADGRLDLVVANYWSATVSGLRNTGGAPPAGVEPPHSEVDRMCPRISPNPACDRVRVSCSIPGAARVEVRILDIAGRRVASSAPVELPAGPHSFELRLVDANGAGLPVGLYFVEVRAGTRSAASRVAVVR